MKSKGIYISFFFSVSITAAMLAALPCLSDDTQEPEISSGDFLLEAGAGFGGLFVTNLEFDRGWTGGPFADFLWGISGIWLGFRLSMPVAVVPYGSDDSGSIFGNRDKSGYNPDSYKDCVTFFPSYSLLMRVGPRNHFALLCALGLGHVASARHGVYSVFPNFYAHIGIEFFLVKTEAIGFGVRMYLDCIKLFFFPDRPGLYFPQVGVVFAI